MFRRSTARPVRSTGASRSTAPRARSTPSPPHASHRFYYSAKPWLPWRLRIAIRRLWARRVRKRCTDSWPILESAGRTPGGWPGWPDGKPFAFVLTHDVEGPLGLARVKQLAELEMSLGFRSSFNFIPEGPYAFPLPLRTCLLDNGFEVGVHDLHQDRLRQAGGQPADAPSPAGQWRR